MTRAEILTLQIAEALQQASKDLRLLPASRRVVVTPVQRECLIQIEVKTNRGELETYMLKLILLQDGPQS